MKIFLLTILNIFVMNAQNNKKDTIFSDREFELSDKITLCEKAQTIKGNVQWEIFLKKGTNIVALLDTITIENCGVPINNALSEAIMFIPKLIDAFKEKQNIFVFLYKDRSAMLQNYTFNEEKKTFKIKEYPLIAIGGGSVMNFGVYNMGVQKIILDDDVAFAEVAASRQVLGGGGLKFLMIEKGEVRELKFKDNYKTVRFKSPISSFEKEYLSKEIKNQFVKHKLLKEKDRFVYYGYLKDNLAANIRGDGNIYLFYKDENNPLSYQVIKYDISTKEWLINGYQKWRVHSTEDKGW